MSSRFSIFIPVYLKSEFLEPLLDNLTEDPYENKEIIVVMNEPTEKSLILVGKYSEKVRFVWKGERKGKANVLNEMVEQSTCDNTFSHDSSIISYEALLL